MESTVTIASWEEVGIYPGAPSGMEYRTQCPLCSATRKPEHRKERDFSIAKDREKGYCHHCGGTVNIRTKGEGTGPAFTFTPVSERKAAFVRPEPISSEEASYEDNFAFWQAFFTDRKLDFEYLVDAFDMSFAKGGTLAIPYFNAEGELINHKYRAMGEKRFWMDAGAERGFYNLHRVVGADVIVIVEGEMDVFAVDQAGVPHVISVPDGAPAPNAKNYASKFDFLESAKTILDEASRIVIAVDADEPGAHLRDELTRRLGRQKVAHVHWPEGTKDANDFLIRYGEAALKVKLLEAEPEPIEGVYTPTDLKAALKAAYLYGRDTGVSMGIPAIDAIYRPVPGSLTVVTGHAGHGKSTVLDNLLVSLARTSQWPIAYFSPEKSPDDLHLEELVEIYLRKPVAKNRKGVHPSERATWEEVEAATDELSHLFSFINPENADVDPSLDAILEMAEAEAFRRGIKGIVLDPWNTIAHNRPKHISETEYVSVALGKITSFLRRHKLAGWLIAHPTKMQDDTGKEAVPGLSNISGSINFRNKADFGLTVYRNTQEDSESNIVTVKVTKARWRDAATMGGEATFIYDYKTNTISEPRPW